MRGRKRLVRGLSPEQGAALRSVAAGETPGDVAALVAMARVLRPIAHLLDPHTPTSWPVPRTALVRKLWELTQLPDAILSDVESGRMALDQAVFVPHADPADPVLVQSRRIFEEKEWSYWHTLSWIAYRDPVLLLKIQSGMHLFGLKWYENSPSLDGSVPRERKPLAELAKARGKKIVVDPDTGALKPLTLVNGAIDSNTRFDAKAVRRLWPAARKAGGAITKAIQDAIGSLWPNRIPPGITAGDRNKRIADYLVANGFSVSNSPEAFRKAVQRAIKRRQ